MQNSVPGMGKLDGQERLSITGDINLRRTPVIGCSHTARLRPEAAPTRPFPKRTVTTGMIGVQAQVCSFQQDANKDWRGASSSNSSLIQPSIDHR